MTDGPESGELDGALDALKRDTVSFFDRAGEALSDIDDWPNSDKNYYWNKFDKHEQDEAKRLIARLLSIGGRIAEAVRKSPLTSDADQRDVMLGIKVMRAALQFRNFSYWDTTVINDEDIVLGVRPEGQSDNSPSSPYDSKQAFLEWADNIGSIIHLIGASHALGNNDSSNFLNKLARYTPNSAFIMMSMDKSIPELADVADTVKRVFRQFGIYAVRADDIQHEGIITDRILNEIERAEFLFADLTHERPNVYYEVGYAHALKRRVILFRKHGTGLHFDIAGYNCPEYNNCRDLNEQLLRRLEHTTNRKPKS